MQANYYWRSCKSTILIQQCCHWLSEMEKNALDWSRWGLTWIL